MPPQTGTALVLIVAFVLPGFITVLIQERTFRRAEDPTPFDRVLRALYYSVWSYALFSGLALIAGIDTPYVKELYESHKDDPAELVWRAALPLLIPVLIAYATKLWHGSEAQRWTLRKLRINEYHTVPTAWDHFFAQRRLAHVRITHTDGTRILGYYGEDSFAAYAKDGRDLYLEHVYAPTDKGWFGEKARNNCGIWVNTSEAVSVEFYSPGNAEQEAARPAEGPQAGEEERSSSPEATAATEEAE